MSWTWLVQTDCASWCPLTSWYIRECFLRLTHRRHPPRRQKRSLSLSGLRMERSGVMEKMGPVWTVCSCRPWLRRTRKSMSTMTRRLEWVCKCCFSTHSYIHQNEYDHCVDGGLTSFCNKHNLLNSYTVKLNVEYLNFYRNSSICI